MRDWRLTLCKCVSTSCWSWLVPLTELRLLYSEPQAQIESSFPKSSPKKSQQLLKLNDDGLELFTTVLIRCDYCVDRRFFFFSSPLSLSFRSMRSAQPLGGKIKKKKKRFFFKKNSGRYRVRDPHHPTSSDIHVSVPPCRLVRHPRNGLVCRDVANPESLLLLAPEHDKALIEDIAEEGDGGNHAVSDNK